MQGKFGAVGLAAGAFLYFHGPLARADDKVAIQVTNDNTDDVIVSLYDMNTTPRSKLLSHQRINGFASIPIAVTAGADGNGHVYWTAVSAKSGARQCGRKDKPGLAADASVHVYAKADCPAR
jgi:hypothetical protein